MDKSHLLMFTVAALALEWVIRPDHWDEFSAALSEEVADSARLTREMAVDLADHLSEHVVATDFILITEAN